MGLFVSFDMVPSLSQYNSWKWWITLTETWNISKTIFLITNQSIQGNTNNIYLLQYFWSFVHFLVRRATGWGWGRPEIAQASIAFCCGELCSSDCSYTGVIVYLGASWVFWRGDLYNKQHMLHAVYIGGQWCPIQSSIGLLLVYYRHGWGVQYHCITVLSRLRLEHFTSLQCTWSEGGRGQVASRGVLWELLSCLSL